MLITQFCLVTGARMHEHFSIISKYYDSCVLCEERQKIKPPRLTAIICFVLGLTKNLFVADVSCNTVVLTEARINMTG